MGGRVEKKTMTVVCVHLVVLYSVRNIMLIVLCDILAQYT